MQKTIETITKGGRTGHHPKTIVAALALPLYLYLMYCRGGWLFTYDLALQFLAFAGTSPINFLHLLLGVSGTLLALVIPVFVLFALVWFAAARPLISLYAKYNTIHS